jgi:hypothetical protein
VDEQPPRRGPAGGSADPSALWESWWRLFGLRAPLSGDVSQAIDASLLHAVGDQLGFINISTSRAGDAQLEQQITEQVASYGRQLGWILDALDVVIRTGRPADLDPRDAAALDQLATLRADIERTKGEVARDRVERLVADIRTLRQDPERYRDELQRLRRALDSD